MQRDLSADFAPWIVVKSNDEKRARLNAMRHVLGLFDYENKEPDIVAPADPLLVGRGRDVVGS